MKIKLGIFSFVFLLGCANVVPPTGGPPDLIGPKVLSVSVDSLTSGFKTYRAEIQFDEMVELKQGSNIYFFPGGYSPSSTLVRKQNLQLQFDSLLDWNGLLDLGDAIRDVNNQNSAQNPTIVVGKKNNLSVDTSRISFSNYLDNSSSFPFWLEIRDSAGILYRKKKIEKIEAIDLPFLNTTGFVATIGRKEKGDSLSRSVLLKSKFEEIPLGLPFGDEGFFGPDSLIDAKLLFQESQPDVLFEFREGKWYRCRSANKLGTPLVSGKVIFGYYSDKEELKTLSKEIKKGENNVTINEFLSPPSSKR